MSPYAEKLANARLDALRTLIDALKEADTPEEKRRCAVAIFNAPDPCDLDEEIELVDDEDDEPEDDNDNMCDESEPEAEEQTPDDQDDITDDDAADNDVGADTLLPPPAPDCVPPSVAALNDRLCDAATASPDNSDAPFRQPAALPIPNTTASRLIAAAGQSP